MSMARLCSAAVLLLCAGAAPALGQSYTADECPPCAEWNAPREPFRIHGNSFYVGTQGLGAILVTSPEGHVLVDGGLPESAPLILANIRALGFRPEDVKLIVNSHAHYDHAGGIGLLQRATGARVAGTAWAARALAAGTSGRDDPQYGVLLPYPPAANVRVIADRDTLRVGPLTLTAHLTAGHTPGGTSWTWRACEDGRCLDLVYADSQTPVSADGFLYTKSESYPSAIADFERGFARLESLSCDVLVTPHPAASGFWERLAAREAGSRDALVDREACRRYAAGARGALARRVATEASSR